MAYGHWLAHCSPRRSFALNPLTQGRQVYSTIHRGGMEVASKRHGFKEPRRRGWLLLSTRAVAQAFPVRHAFAYSSRAAFEYDMNESKLATLEQIR